MTTNKKLTLEDLVTAKLKKEKKREESKRDHYVESLGGEITIELPGEEVIIRALDMIKGETLSSVLESYTYLIYHSVALLRNTELHKECGVLDPIDIVSALLDIKDRLALGEQIMNMANVNNVSDEIKN